MIFQISVELVTNYGNWFLAEFTTKTFTLRLKQGGGTFESQHFKPFVYHYRIHSVPKRVEEPIKA